LTPRERIKNSAKKFAFWPARPSFLHAPIEFFINPVQADRTRDQQTLESKLSFRDGEHPNQGIDDIKLRAIFPDERRRFAGKKDLSKSELRRRRWRAGEGVGKTIFFDQVTGGAPLFGQLHVDADGTESGIPWKIHDDQNTERFDGRHYQNLRRATAVQNLCRTGLT
jgi:hypothetical protein